jgi:hypothetical protein
VRTFSIAARCGIAAAPSASIDETLSTRTVMPKVPRGAAASQPSAAPKTPTIRQQVVDLLRTTIEGFLNGSSRAPSIAKLPKPVADNLVFVIEKADGSYRAALPIQLAYRLVLGAGAEVTQRLDSGRTVAQDFGEFLLSKHIKAVKDAFQSIGKNQANLVRGNVAQFDSMLQWAEKSATDLEAKFAFEYCCAKIAATARAVLPKPRLKRGELTFAAVCQVLDHLYAHPSGGAYEQFTVAALLHALVEQTGAQGHRVETKNLNASDASSRKAGDVQILNGTRVIDAWEITANDWTEKISGAAKTIRDNDLSRLTIVSGASSTLGAALLETLREQPVDLSVVDVKSYAFTMVSALTRAGRDEALSRLYEFLDRLQPDVEVVNHFVRTLSDLSLVDTDVTGA